MSGERDETGRFKPGHKGLGGRPKSEKGQESCEAAVRKAKRGWVRNLRDLAGEEGIPEIALGLLKNAEVLMRGILELEAEESLSSNDLKMLNSLSNSLRLMLTSAHDITRKQRQVSLKEMEIQANPRFRKRVY